MFKREKGIVLEHCLYIKQLSDLTTVHILHIFMDGPSTMLAIRTEKKGHVLKKEFILLYLSIICFDLLSFKINVFFTLNK